MVSAREERAGSRAERGDGWDAWGGTLMPELAVTRADERASGAEHSARVRAQIRKRGQGEKGRGSGLQMQTPPQQARPATVPCAEPRASGLAPVVKPLSRPSTGDGMRTKLGQQWPFYSNAPASESMQRSLARSHNGLLSPGSANVSAVLPIQLQPSPPSSPRGSTRSFSSGWKTSQSARAAHVGPAIDASKGERPTLQSQVAASAWFAGLHYWRLPSGLSPLTGWLSSSD